jgi:hypothetical protein
MLDRKARQIYVTEGHHPFQEQGPGLLDLKTQPWVKAPCNPIICHFIKHLLQLHPDDAWQAYRGAYKLLARKYGIQRTLSHWHNIYLILEFWEQSVSSNRWLQDD